MIKAENFIWNYHINKRYKKQEKTIDEAPELYFTSIKEEKQMKKIDWEQVIEGQFSIWHNEVEIFPYQSIYDLVFAWHMVLEGIYSYLQTGHEFINSGENEFTIELQKQADHKILFRNHWFKKTEYLLPEREFLEGLVEGAKEFYTYAYRYSGGLQRYDTQEFILSMEKSVKNYFEKS